MCLGNSIQADQGHRSTSRMITCSTSLGCSSSGNLSRHLHVNRELDRSPAPFMNHRVRYIVHRRRNIIINLWTRVARVTAECEVYFWWWAMSIGDVEMWTRTRRNFFEPARNHCSQRLHLDTKLGVLLSSPRTVRLGCSRNPRRVSTVVPGDITDPRACIGALPRTMYRRI